MKLLAIDPGPTQSAYVYLRDGDELDGFGRIPNEELRMKIQGNADDPCGATNMVIEKVQSYGQTVGAEVFETVFWTGKFCEAWPHNDPERITRVAVKMHLCHTLKGVNDAVIRQALIDRFGPTKEVAIGRKANPGPLFGVTKDVWQALALAVTFADQHAHLTPD